MTLLQLHVRKISNSCLVAIVDLLLRLKEWLFVMSTETFFVRLCAAQSFRHYVSLSLCTFYRHNWPILWFITWKTAPKTRIIHLQDVVIRFVIDRDLLHIRANVFRNSEYVFLSFLSAFSSTSRTFSKRKTYQRLLWSKRKGEAFEKTSPNNKRDRL